MKPIIVPAALVLAMVATAGCQPASQPTRAAAMAPASIDPGTTPGSASSTQAEADAPRPLTNVAVAASATAADAGPAAAIATSRTRGALPLVVVHKSPTCGCCHLWVEHMREAGFTVDVRDTDDLNTVKERVGVPLGKGSCHTAEVGGYFVEGHVPAEDVRRLLAARPDAKGLVLPGMPAGSPGMEMPDGRVDPYVVELVGRDGGTRTFASHPR